MNINKIIKEELEDLFEIDLVNSVSSIPNFPLFKRRDSAELERMRDRANLSSISLNEDGEGDIVAYRGVKDSEQLNRLDTTPKFGRGLYLTPDMNIAKEYGNEIFKYLLDPKKVYSSPQFNKMLDFQKWSMTIKKEFGDKENWTKSLKGQGYDLIKGYNPAKKEWEFIVLDPSAIKSKEKIETN